MFWQNNQPNPSQQGCRPSGGEGSPFGGDPGGAPFRSPLHRPRYQSSPRYYPQYGCQFPDPYRYPPGGVRPQRSPHNRSPRPDFNYPSPLHMPGNMDSPFHGNGRPMHTPKFENGRGRGNNSRYSSGGRNFSSPGSMTPDSNPGGSDDIRLYYSPDMVQDPWTSLKPVPISPKT